MSYGDNKLKDMARSVLPSTERKASRKLKNSIKRKARRDIRQKLHTIKDSDDFIESEIILDYYPEADINMAVGMRRGADKVNPLRRWAKEKAKDIPDGEKLDYIKSILPGSGTIKDHALSHVEHMDGFRKNSTFNNNRYNRNYNQQILISREQLEKYLYEIIVDGRAHRALNSMIKNNHSQYVTWHKIIDRYNIKDENNKVFKKIRYISIKKFGASKLLGGISDIKDFLNRIVNNNKLPKMILSPDKDFALVSSKILGDDTESPYIENPDYFSYLVRECFELFMETWIDNKHDYQKLEKLRLPHNYNYHDRAKRRYMFDLIEPKKVEE